MGDIKDNRFLVFHRQDGFALPEVSLRLHRGQLGEDFEHLLTHDQVASLVRLSNGPLPAFRAKLVECAPEFCARLREASYGCYQQLFLDVRGMRSLSSQ